MHSKNTSMVIMVLEAADKSIEKISLIFFNLTFSEKMSFVVLPSDSPYSIPIFIGIVIMRKTSDTLIWDQFNPAA